MILCCSLRRPWRFAWCSRYEISTALIQKPWFNKLATTGNVLMHGPQASSPNLTAQSTSCGHLWHFFSTFSTNLWPCLSYFISLSCHLLSVFALCSPRCWSGTRLVIKVHQSCLICLFVFFNQLTRSEAQPFPLRRRLLSF